MKTILAIPCYNCEKQISRVLEEIDPDLAADLTAIWVIDNRSTDRTMTYAKAAVDSLNARCGATKAFLFQNERNCSLGGTHKVAFTKALAEKADYVAILHGDNQALSSELRDLLLAAKQHPDAAAILGARFHWRSRLQGYSKTRILGNVGLNILFSLFTGRLILDLGSGLNLFRTSDLAEMNFQSFEDQLAFNIDLLLDYLTRRKRLVYVPITWRESDQVSNAKTFQIGWRILRKLMRWRFKNPYTKK